MSLKTEVNVHLLFSRVTGVVIIHLSRVIRVIVSETNGVTGVAIKLTKGVIRGIINKLKNKRELAK